MANETLGASFSIDVSELKAGLAQANRLIRESESEFRAAAAGMDDWTKSQEGLEKRQKSLNTQIDLQKGKIENLVKQRDLTIKKMEEEGKSADEIAKATDSINQAITRESKQLDKLKSELGKTTKALDDLDDETDDAENSLEDLGDSAKDAGDGFTVAKGAIAGFIANGLSSLAGAAKDAISSVFGLADSTRESRNEMAKLETSFQTAKLSAEDAEKTFTDLYGIMGDEGAAVEAAQQLAKISKDEKDLAANTRILTGVMAEYGNSIPLEGLAEGIAASSAMSSVQGVLADALEWRGVNLDDFNEKLAALSTEEERSALIQETLTGLYGESADAYSKNNAQIIEANKAQARINESMNKFGEITEPVMLKVKEGFALILEKVLDLVGKVDMEAFGATVDKAFAKFTDEILPAIVDGLNWVIDNKDIIIAGIAGIGAAFAAFKVVSLIQGVVSAMNGMTIAQYALNLAMSLNPIGLIVAAVAGLVAAFVVLWKKCEGFRNFWIGLWDGIKKAFGVVVDWIKENWDTLLLALVNPLGAVFKYCYEHFEGFRNFVDNIIASVKGFFVNLWTSITNGVSAAWNWVVSLLSSVGQWIYDNVIAPVAQFFTDLWNGIVNAYHTVIDPWIEIFKRIAAIVNEEIVTPIKEFFVNLWNDIVAGLTAAWQSIVSVVSVVANWVNENVIMPVANFFVGLWNGIVSGLQTAWGAITGVFSIVAGWVNENVIQPVANFFSKLWSGFKQGAVSAWEGVKSTFSKVASFFGDIFQKAWSKVKEVFSVGGKIFDGIKDGIVKAFKVVVNGIIKGINKVVSLPFKGLNAILDKLTNISIVGVKPFEWLTWRAPIPQIPELATGGVVRKATTAIIGEDGAEAVVPLEKNTGWIKKLAAEIAAQQPQGVVVHQTNHYAQAHSRYEIWQSEKNTASAVKLALMGG